MTTLKLQLHPAELGNVTVKISGTGDEIAIEVQVENTEARQRLASDSDAIVKSLRGLGYDIERVSVQQIAPASNAGQQQTATGGGRGDGFAAFEQRGGERGQNQQGNANPGGRENGQERVASQAQADRGSAAGTVYI
jgi:flagellar hook-length control protein FliK